MLIYTGGDDFQKLDRSHSSQPTIQIPDAGSISMTTMVEVSCTQEHHPQYSHVEKNQLIKFVCGLESRLRSLQELFCNSNHF